MCVFVRSNRKLSHRKLVKLYGVCTQHSPICLIFEYMENGCLSEYLRARKGSLSQDTMLRMCLDVSEGMNYLESSNFLHRDLVNRKTQNNLICRMEWFTFPSGKETIEKGLEGETYFKNKKHRGWLGKPSVCHIQSGLIRFPCWLIVEV